MKKARKDFKMVRVIRLSVFLILSFFWTTAYAENILIAPSELNIKVKTEQIINVSPGRREITNNTDIVLISGLEATFECKKTSSRINPQVVTFWFWDTANAIGAGSSNSGKMTLKDPTASHKVFDSSMILDLCKKFPEGSVRTFFFDIPVQLGAMCFAEVPDGWGVDFGLDIWNTSDTGTVRVKVECDNSLIPAKVRQLSDGRYRNCCSSGWGIANTQLNCVDSDSNKQRYCSKIEKATERIQEHEPPALTTYTYYCPAGWYLYGKDIDNDVSYERRRGDDQWCYSTPASGGQSG